MIQTENNNEPYFVSLTGFEIIDQEIPSSWEVIKRDFENLQVVIMQPKSWSYASFFEDLFDSRSSRVI